MEPELYALDAESAEQYWWSVARRKILARIMGHFIPSAGTKRILEAGCGTGANLPMLRRFGTPKGMELNPTAVAVSRNRQPDIPIIQAAIPTPLDEMFDVICLFDVLEHIDDEKGATSWAADHLSPGGWLFLTVPAFPMLWTRHDELAHHKRRYRMATLLPVFEPCFQVIYASHFNTHLFPIIAGVRLLQRHLLQRHLGLGTRHSDARTGGGRIINPLLREIFAAERLWLPRSKLPFGMSIVVVARRNESLR